MDKYYARICWNSKDWRFPSGEAKAIEGDNTYVAQFGFGVEEWLFNFAWLIEGYHYAFLQPVGHSIKNFAGKTLDILLYTINPKRERIYVGEIRNCKVLSREESEAALEWYKKSGWLQSMREQVQTVGGEFSTLGEAGSMFNVRFRPADVDYYVPPRGAAAEDFINKLNRYTLVRADPQVAETEWGPGRKGTKTPPNIVIITRSGQPSVTYDPIHPALQAELLGLLKIRFGENNVLREEDNVDLTIFHRKAKQKTLVEIKSNPDGILAIREALGQILEYAYRNRDPGLAIADLVIVAPGPETTRAVDYVNWLRTKFSIPTMYCSFSLGGELPAKFNEIAERLG